MRILLSLAACLACAMSLAQSTYAPARGETDIMLTVEGKGDIVIQLHTAEAPKTTARIAQLVKNGFYTNQRFFKVITEPRPFLVQIGDPQSVNGNLDDPSMGSMGSGVQLPYEATKFTNEEGAVGLSTVVDNKNSGDSQFYILLGRHRFLDGRYTVFGKVVQGMDIVHRIEKGDRVTAAKVLTGPGVGKIGQ
ncbi:MAG: peptidylprolyl isomerase [Armatimonadetes bacterium]|nr:peptidylprolyl isomerase [Armatimonadota bacterium]